MTMVIHEEEVEIAHRKACAYLKGYIVGYSVARGMKWDGNSEHTPEFTDGWDDIKGFAHYVTYTHILHNRLRHGRPHRTGGELRHPYLVESDSPGRFDEDHIQYMLWEYAGWTSSLSGKLADMGIDVKALLGGES